jgi:hypothetical protein
VNDPDTHARHAHVDPRLLYDELPPFLVAGNRFGSYGFGAGLSGLLLALAPFGHAVAWILVLGAVVLSATGYIRYAQDRATNRDASAVGFVMGWIGFVILLVDLATTVNLPPAAYYYPAL